MVLLYEIAMIKSNPDNNIKLNVLVTGGAGFLGKAIVQEFLDADSPVEVSELRILDIRDYDGDNDDRIQLHERGHLQL